MCPAKNMDNAFVYCALMMNRSVFLHVCVLNVRLGIAVACPGAAGPVLCSYEWFN